MDLSYLKYREKDELESVFKNYSRTTSFDMNGYWDTRLRAYYAERYDARKALSDWDWQYSVKVCHCLPYQAKSPNQKIHKHIDARSSTLSPALILFSNTLLASVPCNEKGSASIVHVKLFKDWRLNGIAFEFGDQTYTEPNRTFMSYAPGTVKAGKDKGQMKGVQGYWSDVVVSPYFTFGYDSDTPNQHAEGLYQILNKDTGTEQHRHHVVEIAVYNLLSYLWEIETGNVYLMSKPNDIFSGLGSERGKRRELTKEEKEKMEAAVDIETQEERENGGGVENDVNKLNSGTEEIEDVVEGTVFDNSSKSNTLSEEEEANELAKEIHRAECIGESFDDFKIFPLIGDPVTVLGRSEKYKNFFDGMFISLRQAHFMQSEVADTILKPGALIGVETGKFMVHYTKKEKEEVTNKLQDLATGRGWKMLEEMPVFRRRRDEHDTLVDVMFYNKVDRDLDNFKLADSTD